MSNGDIRQIIRAQVYETPAWVRDTCLGLLGGGGLVCLWLVTQPGETVQAPAASVVAAARLQADPDKMEATAGPTGAPLLWRVQKGDATIYLFGSVHVLSPNLSWMDPRLFRAFDGADEAWFEVAQLDVKPSIKEMAQSSYAPRAVLTQGLTDQEKAELTTILNRYNMTLEDAARIWPWAMAQSIDGMDEAAGGFQFSHGADMTLFTRAKALKKTVGGFETWEQQKAYLRDVSRHNKGIGTDSLKRALAVHFGRSDGADDLNVLAKYWRTGDQKALTDDVIGPTRTRDPASYDILLVHRNQTWLPKIEDRLNGKGTVFITVGAAHLVGPDGLVAQLRQRGYTVERVDP